MLAFFPWYTAPEPLAIGRFELLPYEPGSFALAESRVIDAFLGSYTDAGGGRPVRSATIVRLTGREPTFDLTADERAAVFQFADIVAFSALARREFFAWGTTYVNRDHFRLIIQSIPPEGEGAVSIRARRRDGSRTTGYSSGEFRSMRPPHVSQGDNPAVDVSLVSALLAASETERWLPYEESIFSFNAANTDSDETPEQHETVAMVGAFQQLLEADGNALDIARKLLALIGPFLAPAPGGRRLLAVQHFEVARNARGGPSSSITEAWIRDFFHARNPFGHGRSRQDKPSYWTPRAHLLLGAYLFPLALLVKLANDGFYTLSDAERKRLFAFTYLARLRNPFRRRRLLGRRSAYAWNCALEAASRQRLRDELGEVFGEGEAPEFETGPFRYGPGASDDTGNSEPGE